MRSAELLKCDGGDTARPANKKEAFRALGVPTIYVHSCIHEQRVLTALQCTK